MNKTLYVNDEDEEVVRRASKLLAFHEDISLSAFLVEQCRKIVARYDSKGQDNK